MSTRGFLDRAGWPELFGYNREDYCRECWVDLVRAQNPRIMLEDEWGIRYTAQLAGQPNEWTQPLSGLVGLSERTGRMYAPAKRSDLRHRLDPVAQPEGVRMI